MTDDTKTTMPEHDPSHEEKHKPSEQEIKHRQFTAEQLDRFGHLICDFTCGRPMTETTNDEGFALADVAADILSTITMRDETAAAVPHITAAVLKGMIEMTRSRAAFQCAIFLREAMKQYQAQHGEIPQPFPLMVDHDTARQFPALKVAADSATLAYHLNHLFEYLDAYKPPKDTPEQMAAHVTGIRLELERAVNGVAPVLRDIGIDINDPIILHVQAPSKAVN
jgi:hypothetical protein